MSSAAEDALAVIQELIASGESFYVEFKSAWDYGPDDRRRRDRKEIAADIGKTIVAFANADGGDLLVGVEDDGNITGIPHSPDHVGYLRAWQNQLANRGEGVSVRVFNVELGGRRILLFRVEASDGLVATTSDGRCLMRRKDTSVPVPPREIERRRTRVRGDRSYEAEPVPEAGIDALDWELIARVYRAQRENSTLDHTQLLRYWNLVEQRNGSVILRRAALLLFAKEPLRWHPNNRVRIRRVHGEQVGFGRGLRSREREFLGPIANLLRDAQFVLYRELARESREDQLFSTNTLLPREAVDECLVNAVVHRNYAIEGQAVEILLYPDRVEFKSPGGLPEPITIEDLRAQEGVHRSRNPIMMRVLRDLGWTRDQGEGMQRIFGSMRQVELHEPELEDDADTFTVRLSTRSVYDPQTQAWIASYGPFGLQPEQRRYMVALREAGKRQSVDRLARQLGESYDETKRELVKLERMHLVSHPKGSRTYHLVESANVLHERAFRVLSTAGRTLDGEFELERRQLATLVGTNDEQTTSSLIAQWKQAGILKPGSGKRLKLGASFLAYVRQRHG